MYEDQWETIDERESRGFALEVAVTPDTDYTPGVDDDAWPSWEWMSYGDAPADPADYPDDYRDEYGQFLPRPVVASGRSAVVVIGADELATWADAMGFKIGAARKLAQSFADGIASEMIAVYGVRVIASRNGLEGSASLWGVEVDHRDRSGHAMDYPHEVGRELEDEAIDECVRALLGGLAPMAQVDR